MLFWILAIALTAIACAVLLYAAAAKGVNAPSTGGGEADAAYRGMLADIDRDQTAGRLSAEEAEIARSELAREVIRDRARPVSPGESASPVRAIMIAGIGLVAIVSFGLYQVIGEPGLPSTPLAERIDAAEQEITGAISRMELHLAANPDDAEGWSVLAPVYVDRGRFDDAANAYRQVIALSGATADLESDLAEALMMAADGVPGPQSIALWQNAAERDPAHIRSRFYLAGEATQAGRYEEAVTRWTELLAMADGTEPWFGTAHSGLAIAEAALTGEAPFGPAVDADQQEMIRGMVEGLAQRLEDEGGSVEEWTRLVRSRLVLGETGLAQAAYDTAVATYPDAAMRTELDALAREGGLDLAGDAQ